MAKTRGSVSGLKKVSNIEAEKYYNKGIQVYRKTHAQHGYNYHPLNMNYTWAKMKKLYSKYPDVGWFIEKTKVNPMTRVRKKRRTPAQIRATKKLVALNRKRKRVGTSQTKKSMTTKKAPSKRLKKRRAKNTKPKYYPNPIGYYIVVKNIRTGKLGYFTGTGFDSEKKQAIMSRSKQVMVNVAKNIPQSSVGREWDMFVSTSGK